MPPCKFLKYILILLCNVYIRNVLFKAPFHDRTKILKIKINKKQPVVQQIVGKNIQ